MKQTLVLLAAVFVLSGCAAEETPSPALDGASTGALAPADTGAAPSGAFRLTVADVFPVAGRGVVITGIVAQGKVTVGETVCLASAAGGTRSITVGGIEIIRNVVDSAQAGDSVGLSISGIEQADVSRGDEVRARC